jgi:hypothetical protein
VQKVANYAAPTDAQMDCVAVMAMSNAFNPPAALTPWTFLCGDVVPKTTIPSTAAVLG